MYCHCVDKERFKLPPSSGEAVLLAKSDLKSEDLLRFMVPSSSERKQVSSSMPVSFKNSHDKNLFVFAIGLPHYLII